MSTSIPKPLFSVPRKCGQLFQQLKQMIDWMKLFTSRNCYLIKTILSNFQRTVESAAQSVNLHIF